MLSSMNPDLLKAVRTPHKYPEPLVRASYQAGDYDSNAVDAPFLFWHDGRYRMLINCFDGTGYRTGLASSDDLINWDRDGLVHDRGMAGSDTEFNVGIVTVLRDNELYGRGDAKLVNGELIGVWHGYPELGQEQGRGYFGICRGKGLQDWRLEPACLRAEDGEPWEQGGLYKPCIVEHEGRYYIFYNAKENLDWPWVEQIGVIWSDDLVNWTRCAGNPIVPAGGPGSPDEIFAADPCILRHGDRWVMFYYGLAADKHARELVAFSDDLIHWEKSDEVLIDVGPKGSLDDQYAHKPGVIARDCVLYHYYGASRKKTAEDVDEVNAKDRRVIAVATSQPV